MASPTSFLKCLQEEGGRVGRMWLPPGMDGFSGSNHISGSRFGFSLWRPHSRLLQPKGRTPLLTVPARVPRMCLTGLDWAKWYPPLSQPLWQEGMECCAWPDLVTCLSQQLWEAGAYENPMDQRKRVCSWREILWASKRRGSGCWQPSQSMLTTLLSFLSYCQGCRAQRHRAGLQSTMRKGS